MIGIARGISTLLGAAVAGFLIWLAAQIGAGTAGEYWLTYGLIASAGFVMALSQLLGGWTKYGWPRLSLGVLLLGFLPVLLVGGWVLLARQPADFFNTSDWSRDLGVMGVVGALGEFLAAIAFGIGLTLGFTFDTAGPRREVVEEHVADDRVEAHHVERAPEPRTATVGPAQDGDSGHEPADEPLTAETRDEDYREPDAEFRRTIASDRREDDRT
ncbi:MAG TPA: hypothetical protein VNT23_02720 [Gaiellaceae bacterium]|nr:hypothetical protein [Gaiellaceae bacterium]